MTADRFFERTRAERRRRWIRIALAVLAVVAAGALVWLVWFSTVLDVRGTEVSGRATLKESQVLRVAQVPTGRPLARVDVEAIEERVSQINRVESVDVSRSWPHTLSISIVERRPVVWTTRDGQIRGIDRNGIDYRSFRSAPDGLPEATITAADSEDRLEITQAVAAVIVQITADDPALRKEIQAVSAASKDSVELTLSKGRTVVWGSSADGRRKLTVLTSLLGIKATRYDVSAPDQPTTRE